MAFFDDALKILGQVAPTIATAVGGPVAGIAVRALGAALGLSDSATQDDVMKAVVGASPEQLAAIKKADQDFAVRMRELDIDLEKIAADDRASARQRERDTGDSWTPRLLAFVVSVGFFGVLAYMMTKGLPNDAGGRDAMILMLGSLGTAWTGVMAFYFGSSSSSRTKDSALATAIKK